ncbi:class I SAM-dependent methyltransferase [Arthrobacter monumenti]
MDFEALVEQAVAADGWDFSVYGNRVQGGVTPWNYESLAASAARDATSMLDMGTGGGEVLVDILEDVEGEAPPYITATEGWEPNLSVARAALEPYGVSVVAFSEDAHLPLTDGQFDLVINSHEFYHAGEVARVLAPGGTYLTQQIGGRDLAELNAALGAPPLAFAQWDLDYASQELRGAGLVIESQSEAMIPTVFADVGAVISFVQAVGWQIPGFTIDNYLPQLRTLHDRISRDGPFTAHSHRFLLQGQIL